MNFQDNANPEALNSYRAGMFDGEPGLDWLRPAWRGLRLYGRKAKLAINAGNMPMKAEMVSRADQMLSLLTGILDTADGTVLGPALMKIYASLQATLLRANLGNDSTALDEFDRALLSLEQNFTAISEKAEAA